MRYWRSDLLEPWTILPVCGRIWPLETMKVTMQTMQPHVMICCCSPQDVTAFGAAGSAVGTPEDVHPRGTLPPAAALKGSCTIQCITKTYKNVLMDVVSQGTWCLSQSQPRSVLTEDVDGCRILLSHHPDGEKIWESINHVRLLDTVNQHSVALLVELWRRLEKYAAMPRIPRPSLSLIEADLEELYRAARAPHVWTSGGKCLRKKVVQIFR